MRGLVFLTLIPSLMAAQVLCPNGKTTCPEELYCCEVDGEHACCDLYATTTMVPETKVKIFPGVETTEVESSASAFFNTSLSADVPQHYPYGQCSIVTCQGPCCSPTNCCPHQFGNCCSSDRCCGSFSPCCGNGCCGAMGVCCNSRCCGMGQKCCGTWCCDSKYKCGKKSFTCTNKGITFSSDIATVLVLVLGLLMSRHL